MQDATRPTREVRALFPPDFDWCGGCAGKSRSLTEAEALTVLQGLVPLVGRYDALAILDALAWPLEIHDRQSICACDSRARDALPPAGGFHVYRLWSADNRLLYVGSSVRLRARLGSHVRRWGDLIARTEWEEHASAEAMLEAEAEAIREEYPAMNKALVR